MEIKNLISKCTGSKSSVILHLAFEKDMGNVSLDTSGLQNDASIMGTSPLLPSLGKSFYSLCAMNSNQLKRQSNVVLSTLFILFKNIVKPKSDVLYIRFR